MSSNRVTRVSSDGSVYSIQPRLIVPKSEFTIEAGHVRRFWMTVDVPPSSKPGVYRGQVTVRPEHGPASRVAVVFRVYAGQLDPVDISVGPWGHTVDIPWLAGAKDTLAWNESMGPPVAA